MDKFTYEQFPPSKDCCCGECQSMCLRPCWGTPEQIKALIDAGYGNRLMLDYYCADKHYPEHVRILSPACIGHERKHAPFMPINGCTFLNGGLCMLHHIGLKPLEGRVASCKDEDRERVEKARMFIVDSWNTEEAKELVATWVRDYVRK